MKLYGTITSERATKGQGGNEYLLIDLLDENQNKFLQIHVTTAHSHARGEHKNIYIYNPKAEYVAISQTDFIEKEKGKRQKDEAICAIRSCSNPAHKHSWMK